MSKYQKAARHAFFNKKFSKTEQCDEVPDCIIIDDELDFEDALIEVSPVGEEEGEPAGESGEGDEGETSGSGDDEDEDEIKYYPKNGVYIDKDEPEGYVILASKVKNEHLKYRQGIKWCELVFDVVRENNIPVEYICRNDPDLVVNKQPLFNHEYVDYFSHQQKESINAIEGMELNNAVIVQSGFFDENVLNNFAISSNLGFLSNDVGSGKTRIAVAVAFRNLYSQKRENNTLRKLPIVIYREKLGDSEGPQKFKQFFGAKELANNPISDINVNKLGNELEKGIQYKCIDSTLMVVSPSTFHQWKQEVLDMNEKFKLENDNFLFISSNENFTTSDPIDDPEYEEKVKRVKENLDKIHSNKHPIIVMTNKWYNDSLISSPKPISFNRIFFDEPDTIEYKASNKIVSRFTWLISTTIKQWISERYNTIKGTDEFAGRDSATRVGEAELCIYDDPSLADVIISSFGVRDESSPIDNSERLDFIKYKDFGDSFYKVFSKFVDSSIVESLSSYDIEKVEDNLGTEKVSFVDKLYAYVEGLHSSNAEVTALDLKFAEQTKFATDNPQNKLICLESKNYIELKEQYEKRREEMCKSIAARDEIYKGLDGILEENLVGAECLVCKGKIKSLEECYVSDCCFGISHIKCVDNDIKKVDAKPEKKVVLRRRKTIKEKEEEAKKEAEAAEVAEAEAEAAAAAAAEGGKVVETEGSNNTTLFKDIIFSTGKVLQLDENAVQFEETDVKGNKISTKGIFDITRKVAQKKFKAFEDSFTEKEVLRYDCRSCGIVNALTHPVKKSSFLKRLPPHICNPRVNKKKVSDGETRQKKIIEMLKNREKDQKFLIYATNSSNITKALDDTVPFKIVSGDAYERERAIVEYRRGDIKVLVLLNHENAAGLNLTETTDLVIFNQTSDTIAEQVIGRVDRLGLNHTVKVHLFDTNKVMLDFIESKYKKILH